MSQSDAVLTREDNVQRDAGRSRGLRRLSEFLFHPLLAILAVQAVVSGRLAWVNSAFGDEAHYLADGHVEWQGWLHGTPIPVMHDSGAPQIYPPIGAAVAALGGLPLARLLSLAFMLGATALLYATAHRMFGRVAALWAAGLGAFNEPVLRLTFATYDPLSILLVMTAVYVAVRSATARRRGELVAVAGVCLMLSALVAVSYAIFIPVVMAIMLCVWAEQRGWANAIVPVVWQFVLIGALGVIGVSQLHVWSDFVGTTVDRKQGLGAGVISVLSPAWGWGGLVLCVAVAGAVLAFASAGWRHPRAWLVAVLALADVAVPAYQAFLGTGYSMDKHMAPGAELAAMAGGYAISRARVSGLRSVAAFGASAALLVFPVINGSTASDSVFHQWPDTTGLIAALRGQLSASAGSSGPVGSAGSSGSVGSGGAQPGVSSLLVGTAGPGNFNPEIFNYYLPHTDVRTSSDPATAADIKAGLYSVAVQDLNSPSLEAAASAASTASAASAGSSGGPTPALRSAVLTAEKQQQQNQVGAELAASRRYTIANVLPYTTNNAANPSGVFVIWTAVPAS